MEMLKTRKFVVTLFMMSAFALLGAGGTAMAGTTVSNESGDVIPGSLRAVMGSGAATINFAPDVSVINLNAAAESSASNLTITGRQNGFEASLAALLLGYGIPDAGSANFTGVQLLPADLSAAIAGLSRPGITIDGKGGNFRLLDFAGTT